MLIIIKDRFKMMSDMRTQLKSVPQASLAAFEGGDCLPSP